MSIKGVEVAFNLLLNSRKKGTKGLDFVVCVNLLADLTHPLPKWAFFKEVA